MPTKDSSQRKGAKKPRRFTKFYGALLIITSIGAVIALVSIPSSVQQLSGYLDDYPAIGISIIASIVTAILTTISVALLWKNRREIGIKWIYASYIISSLFGLMSIPFIADLQAVSKTNAERHFANSNVSESVKQSTVQLTQSFVGSSLYLGIFLNMLLTYVWYAANKRQADYEQKHQQDLTDDNELDSSSDEADIIAQRKADAIKKIKK